MSATPNQAATAPRPARSDVSRRVREGRVRFANDDYTHPIFLELEGCRVAVRPTTTTDRDRLHIFVDGRWAGEANARKAPGDAPHRGGAMRPSEVEHRSLDGARLVETENYILCDDAIAAAVEDLEMVACFGEAGLGKTYAARRAAERHAKRLRRRHVLIVPRQAMLGGALVASLLEQLYDVRLVRPSTQSAHFALLLDKLAEPTVVHIDEAQYLTAHAMHIVRHIDDLSHIPVCFVLSGGNTFWKVLSSDPMLKDRVPHRVPFRRFRSDEIPSVARAFHPMFDAATDAQLLRLDELYAHGVFRAWRHIARSFQRYDLDPARDSDHDKVLIRLGARRRGA